MNNRLTRALARGLYRFVAVPVRKSREPDFRIGPADDPYIRRWWVIRRNRWFNIYLHQVLRDDSDRAMHDHPWLNATIVLDGGGYVEFQPGGARLRRVGDVVLRRPTAAHRLELTREDGIPQPTWTLFITGPRVRRWGFYLSWEWAPFDAVVAKTGSASEWLGDGEEAEIRAVMTREAMEGRS